MGAVKAMLFAEDIVVDLALVNEEPYLWGSRVG